MDFDAKMTRLKIKCNFEFAQLLHVLKNGNINFHHGFYSLLLTLALIIISSNFFFELELLTDTCIYTGCQKTLKNWFKIGKFGLKLEREPKWELNVLEKSKRKIPHGKIPCTYARRPKVTKRTPQTWILLEN